MPFTQGCYAASSGRVLLAGGNANNGANAGAFYGNWNNAASNSNWNYAVLPLQSKRPPEGGRRTDAWGNSCEAV